MRKDIRILDYEASSKESRRRNRLKRIRRALLMFALLPVAGIALCVVSFFLILEVRRLAFDAKTGESKILGKTPQQIISSFGTPERDNQIDINHFDMKEQGVIVYYDDSSGEICRIQITNGIATRVEHFSK